MPRDSLTPKARFLAALERREPDRLPVTTHHLMPSFLSGVLGGISEEEFFGRFGIDPILWLHAVVPADGSGAYPDPVHSPGHLEARRLISEEWRIIPHELAHPEYRTMRYDFVTPRKTLSMVLQSDAHTTWVTERLIREKRDIDLIARYAPSAACDVAEINRQAGAFGERGLVRGMVPGFDVYGQPGCWQDAAVLFGIEELIMATFDDPAWVREFLGILRERKSRYIASLAGARFDLIELGGGDASSTVISPSIFEYFVAPYDAPLIAQARAAGQRIVYHTCGGMMAFLELIAGMRPDAMETFTPEGMGGDADLAEAKKRLGSRVWMIGGFDQFHFFRNCSPEETRREVRRCFEAAGRGGGYILAPSDHFFEADPALLAAFAEEARKCAY